MITLVFQQIFGFFFFFEVVLNNKRNKFFFLKNRHVVHVGSDKIEVYDEKGGPIEKRKQSFEISLERKQSGFGMNIRTLEDGKTIVSVIN